MLSAEVVEVLLQVHSELRKLVGSQEARWLQAHNLRSSARVASRKTMAAVGLPGSGWGGTRGHKMATAAAWPTR